MKTSKQTKEKQTIAELKAKNAELAANLNKQSQYHSEYQISSGRELVASMQRSQTLLSELEFLKAQAGRDRGTIAGLMNAVSSACGVRIVPTGESVPAQLGEISIRGRSYDFPFTVETGQPVKPSAFPAAEK